MQLGNQTNSHLTYCTNIHPGETWDDVFNQLKTNLPELKRRLSPDDPFGVGLRLSAEAADEISQQEELQEFKHWLDEEDLYVFTMNGFPYGSFHGERVKDEVYRPDWTSEKRLDYTLNLVEILAELLPDGIDGGISTSPVSYKPWITNNDQQDDIFRLASRHLAEAAYRMAEIRQETGKELHLDIEPEPDCLIENTAETIEFFEKWLLKAGAAQLAVDHSYSQEKAEDILLHHIRVCYDTCHFAVEYEEPAEAINQLKEAGIKIGKVQISAALKTQVGDNEQEIRSKLKPFVEDTYLHQVIERRADGTLHHYPDLNKALDEAADTEAEEWRIHYHVPIFVDEFDNLQSTQDDIVKSLEQLIGDEECHHFEIETYTWDVLPENLKQDLLDSIEREFRWTLEQIDSF